MTISIRVDCRFSGRRRRVWERDLECRGHQGVGQGEDKTCENGCASVPNNELPEAEGGMAAERKLFHVDWEEESEAEESCDDEVDETG